MDGVERRLPGHEDQRLAWSHGQERAHGVLRLRLDDGLSHAAVNQQCHTGDVRGRRREQESSNARILRGIRHAPQWDLGCDPSGLCVRRGLVPLGARIEQGFDPLPRGAVARMEECRLVRLEGGIEEVWKRASGKRRQLARRGERAGLDVRFLEREEEIRRFHAIYARESRGWGGVHPYPERLFLELWRRREAGVVFVGAFLEGDLLGAHIDFFHGGVAQAWQGGMTPLASEHEAGSLCIRKAMAEACERGMHTFNLGSSAGERGIVFFKESLGAGEYRYPVVTMRGAAGRLLGRGRGR